MCTKFVSSGKGVIERLTSAVAAVVNGETTSELRREVIVSMQSMRYGMKYTGQLRREVMRCYRLLRTI